MSTCHRFENEALLRLEQGLPLDPHFSTCPDCQDARLSYERLQRDIASLGPMSAPPGWEHRVWQELSTRRADAHPRRWLLVAGMGLAATIAALVVLSPLVQRQGTPTLSADVREGTGPAQRGTITPGAPVVLGSRLELNAATGGARYAELRVYRNDDQLILQISKSDTSTRPDTLRATLLLDAVGRYQPVLFVSGDPISPPSGRTPDDDYISARKLGTQTILGALVSVR